MPNRMLHEENDRAEGRLFTPNSTALYTDLYHVDAAFVGWVNGLNGRSTFDLYTRRAPFGGSFMLTAGLGPAVDYIRNFQYADEDLAYLQRIKAYPPAFLDFLKKVRFTGSIEAVPEGEIAFPNEPLLRVTAPFVEALLLESGLLRTVGVSTLIATKAARLTIAARGRPISDFGFRRAHDPHLAARSGYIGGCASTSFVAAAKEYDIPAAGTVPHALIQAFPDELSAFRAIATSLPSYSLLLDTYDVATAIRHAVQVAREASASHGHVLAAVRLDSGDLASDSRMVKSVLDDAGLTDVKVLVSGDIDEYRIEELLISGAPVDGFGVGGNLGVGLGNIESGSIGGVIGAVYKLAWYEGAAVPENDGRPAPARIKLAGDKSTWPGIKRAWRIGAFERDMIQLEVEGGPPNGRSLALPWIENGELVGPEPSLKEIRARADRSIAGLPPALRALTTDATYPVDPSDALVRLRDETIAALGQHGT
jgi:nicotinate phosphoribosyltransferase